VWLVPEGDSGPVPVTRNGQTVFTKDNSYYRPFDQPAYNLSNVNNDFAAPNRRDYAIVPSGPSFVFHPGDAVTPTRHAGSHEIFPTRLQCHAPQVQIVNSQGRLRVLNLHVEGKLLPEKTGSNG
jgi:hypothetical protein